MAHKPASSTNGRHDSPRRARAPKTGVSSMRLSPTEERNPRSTRLDRMPLPEAIKLMLSEETRVPSRIAAKTPAIARAILAIVRAVKRGGRLLYVGAGTSGRLGLLDASECPPTFRTPPGQVQAIIAGGQQALWKSFEGAEDDPESGARAIAGRKVEARDVVVGIAASGTTPFVWGALREGKQRGATTVLVCFNPHLRIPRSLRPTLVIAPSLGPEVLTGSTRLKAGTATKLILNLFTTLAMVRLGKVHSNLMIDLNPSNQKLRNRAVRIVAALSGKSPAEAISALRRADWDLRAALRLLPAVQRRRPD